MKNSPEFMDSFSITLADVWHIYVCILGDGYTHKCKLQMYLHCIFIKLMYTSLFGRLQYANIISKQPVILKSLHLDLHSFTWNYKLISLYVFPKQNNSQYLFI